MSILQYINTSGTFKNINHNYCFYFFQILSETKDIFYLKRSLARTIMGKRQCVTRREVRRGREFDIKYYMC